MKKIYDNIICTGSIGIDRIMNFSGSYKDLIQVDKIHVLSLSVLIDKLTNSRGGTAANIAYSLALLGQSPTLLGSIGADAKEYLADLGKIGIDTNHVHLSDLPTATFTVLTDKDDNQVGGFYPGAMSDLAGLTLKPWQGKKTLIVISANDPLAMDKLIEECLALNLDYVYDVGQQVSNITKDQLNHGLKNAAILFVNDYEFESILKKTGLSESELNQMIPLIVTTLGAKGTRITGSEVVKPITVPAVKNVKVVDPTGAGDCYRAGFLYGYIRGLDLIVCASLGSVCAVYTVETHGTQNHTFPLAEIKNKLYVTYGVNL